MNSIPQWCQSIEPVVTNEIDTATGSSSPSRRSTKWGSLFSSKGNASIAAVSTSYVNSSGIKEFPFGIILLMFVATVVLFLPFLPLTPSNSIRFNFICIKHFVSAWFVENRPSFIGHE
jgi:hypothetical protein